MQSGMWKNVQQLPSRMSPSAALLQDECEPDTDAETQEKTVPSLRQVSDKRLKTLEKRAWDPSVTRVCGTSVALRRRYGYYNHSLCPAGSPEPGQSLGGLS